MKIINQLYIYASILGLLALSQINSSAQNISFEKPYTISENQQMPSSSIITYRKVKDALAAVADSSTNFVDLNGGWQVKFVESPFQITTKDLDPKTEISSWGGRTVQIPGAWQLSGEGSALYSEKAYPFLKSEPKSGVYDIPKSGTVAIYAKDFSVPFDYMDKKLYLTVGAAASKVTLYVNGEEIGFSTDSKNPVQFDITNVMIRGRNRAVLMVEEFSGASWVEDASGWRLNGVNRGVYLLAQPKIRMRDALTTTTFSVDRTTGLLQSALLLKSELLNPHTVTVYYDLYDTSGKIIRKENKDVHLDMRREDTVRFHSSIQDVEAWSSETPNLYTVVYTVRRENRITEVAAIKVGFRSVEIEDGKLLINGQAPQIRGVNIEETNPKTGNVLSREELKAQMQEMRLMGINAIRTGGYPMPQYFYDLADSIGFYVFSIANLNTQGLSNSLTKGGSLANNPAWADVFVQRAVTTYERTNNNPSVIAVGLGENAGNGYSMYEAYNAVRARNNSVVILYDGANAEWNTDIVCPLYPTISQLEELKSWKVLQPVIPSRVNFDKKYWQLEGVQGAFIDRWQGATLNASSVKSYKELSDDYKLQNRSNGTVKQSSVQSMSGSEKAELIKLFAPFVVEEVDSKEGLIRITNQLQQTNLNQLELKYRRVSAGKAKDWVVLTGVDCPVGESVEVVLERYDAANMEIEIEIEDLYKGKL